MIWLPRPLAAPIAAVAAAMLVQPALGQQAAPGFSYALRAGASYSDNINRVPARFEQSAAAAVAGIDLEGSRPNGRLRYTVAASLLRYEFLDLDLEGQTFGRAAFDAEFDILPDVFWWNGRITYEQLREDILRPIAVGNLIDQVSTSLGPTFRVELGSVVEAQIDARYSRTDFSGSFPDNETVGGRAQLLRRRSALSTIGIGVSYDDTTYAQASFFGFRRNEAFVRFESALARTEIDAELGYAQVSGNAVDQSGAMLRTRLTRRVAPTLRAHVSYVREYPTSQGAVVAPGAVPGTGVPGGGVFDVSILTAAPRLSSVGEVGLTYQRPRTTAEIAYSRRNEEALIAGIGTRDYDEYRLRIRRQMTPRSRLSGYWILTSDVFPALSLSVDEIVVGGELAFDIGRAVGVDLRAEHRTRDGNFAGEFSETNVGIYLRYFGRSARRP